MRLYAEDDPLWRSYSCVMTRDERPSPECAAFLAYLGSDRSKRNVLEPMTRNIVDPRARSGRPIVGSC